VKKERLMIPCGEIALEGVLWIPEGVGPFPGVVVCHPHPLYGGNMNVNIVHEVCVACGERSIASLRFNFRGVGKSGGRHENGIGEREDVKAALSFLERRAEIDPHRLGLCGYSFGTMVGIPVADGDERVKALAGISSFFVAPGLLQGFRKPKFFIHGDRDTFISAKQVREIVEGLPDPKTFETIPGADHFWGGFERVVGTKVGDFFASALTNPKAMP